MRLAIRFAWSLPFVILGSTDVHAHPGHAREAVAAESPWHYVLQPEHALTTGIGVAIIGGLAGVTARRIQIKQRQLKMQPIRVRR